MTTRNKKPKCSTANKACGMACKPKAAICADQRKKLVANSKKAGLKGQAAKNYVQARIDRYKSLVDNKGVGGVRSGKKSTDTVTRTPIMSTPTKPPSFDGTRNPKNTTPYTTNIVDTDSVKFSGKAAKPSPLLSRKLANGVETKMPIVLETSIDNYKVVEGGVEFATNKAAGKEQQNVLITKTRAEAAAMALQRQEFNKAGVGVGNAPLNPRTTIVDLDSLYGTKSSAPKDTIDKIARLIVSSGRVTDFPTVRGTGIDRYQVKEGSMVILAYKRARELDPSLPDRILVRTEA